MKKYETPKILVLKLDDGDVIKTSGTGGDVHEDDKFDDWGW